MLSYRLVLEGTVHEGRADRLLLGGGPRKDRPRWWNWTVANTSSTGRPRSPSRSMARSSPDWRAVTISGASVGGRNGHGAWVPCPGLPGVQTKPPGDRLEPWEAPSFAR